MIRLLFYFACVVAAAAALAWLADQPGTISIVWQDTEYATSIFTAVVGLTLLAVVAMLAWSLFTGLLSSPGALLEKVRRHREQKSATALSRGLIAVGSGDVRLARKYAKQAARGLPGEPMSALLRAQAAQLAGDRHTVQRIYEAMLESPETELLGLRGLFNEASREQKLEAARHYAERALKLNANLAWAAEGLLNLQCREQDWAGALDTLKTANLAGQIGKDKLKRWKAALLTARARELEDEAPDEALQHALDAHALAPTLVPAAELAGHLLANAGNMARAAQIVRKTWKRNPHPDLATVYAYLRQGDSPRDRLQRIQTLYKDLPAHPESMIATAHAAIEAHDWKEARRVLKPLLQEDPSARVCTLMARIEGGEFGDKGRVREWLARALKAPRDPVWIADGHISDSWEPVSPVSGRLDAYEWRVPDQMGMTHENDLILDDLMTLPAITASAESKAVVPAPESSQSASEVAAEEQTHAAAPVELPKTAAAKINGSNGAMSPSDGHDGMGAEPKSAPKDASGPAITQPPPDDPGPDYDEADLDPKPGQFDPRFPTS